MAPERYGYLSHEAYVARVAAAVRRAGERVSHEVIGSTVEGRPIERVTIAAPGRRPDPGRPQAFVLGGMHGCEVVAQELDLAVIEAATEPEPIGDASDLLGVADLTVVPVLNIDGRVRALASLDAPGLFKPAPRRNANGVDLNRNWPFPAGVRDHWLPLAGTTISWLPWYRGPHPLSEPETRALDRLVRQLRPFALLNLHSTGQILTYPWSSKPEPSPHLEGFRAMVEAFNGRQRRWVYRSKQSRAWYPIVGSSNDYFHDALGTLPLTVEVSPSARAVRDDWRRARWLFWYANPADPSAHVANDLEGCFAALVAAHRYVDARRPAGRGPH